MWKLLGGLASLGILVLLVLLIFVSIFSVQLSSSPSGSGSCLPTASNTISPPGNCPGGSNALANAARTIAQHLYGNPDAWYDGGMPQLVLNFWAQSCPSGSGCWLDWQEGNLQCVLFVTATYALAGSPLPATGNAIDFWSLYQDRPGWMEIPSATAPPAQRSLPMPGDIMVWSDPAPLVGHIAIVVGVNPPVGGKDGSVTFAEANGPGVLVTETLLPDLSVVTWSDPIPYIVLGYIRSLTPIGLNASYALVRVSQLDPGQYSSTAEYNTWALSACSAAAMTEVLNAYGKHYRITDILAVEAQRGDITPALGLVSQGGIADTVAHFGFQTSWGTSLSLQQVIAVANQGSPVIVDFPPDRYPGGHLLVVTGGTADAVSVADSSDHNYTRLSWAQFLQWWNGFSAIVTPRSG